MLFNKNNVRKANDKKVLHKVHKNWIVVSTALLLAIGGGAVAAHTTTANADNTGATNVSAEDNTSYNLKPASDGTGGTPVNAVQKSASASKVPLNDNLIMENNAIKSLAAQGENADQIVANVQPSVASYNANAHFDLFGLNGHNASEGANYSANNNLIPNPNPNPAQGSIAAPDVTKAVNDFANVSNANMNENVLADVTAVTGNSKPTNIVYMNSMAALTNSFASLYTSAANELVNIVPYNSSVAASASEAAYVAQLNNNLTAYNSYSTEASNAVNDVANEDGRYYQASSNAALYRSYANSLTAQANSVSASAASSNYNSNAMPANNSYYMSEISDDSNAGDSLAKSYDINGFTSAISSVASSFASGLRSLNTNVNSEKAEFTSLNGDEGAAGSNGIIRSSVANAMIQLSSATDLTSTEFSLISNEASEFKVYIAGANVGANIAAYGATTPVSDAIQSYGSYASSVGASLGTATTLAGFYGMAAGSLGNMTSKDSQVTFSAVYDLNTGSSDATALDFSRSISATSEDISNDVAANGLNADLANYRFTGTGNYTGSVVANDSNNAAAFNDGKLGTSNAELDIMKPGQTVNYVKFLDANDGEAHPASNPNTVEIAGYVKDGKMIASQTQINNIAGGSNKFEQLIPVGVSHDPKNPVIVPVNYDIHSNALDKTHFAVVNLKKDGNIIYSGVVATNTGNASASRDHPEDMVQTVLQENGQNPFRYSAIGTFGSYANFVDNVKPNFVTDGAVAKLFAEHTVDHAINIPVA